MGLSEILLVSFFIMWKQNTVFHLFQNALISSWDFLVRGGRELENFLTSRAELLEIWRVEPRAFI